MRSHCLIWALPLLVVSATAGACAAPSGDNADGQAQDVTGGSGSVESPVVFLFDNAAAGVAPKCAGAMLSDTIAVTAKDCAKAGLLVGRAADKDGHGARAKITAVHVPDAADADIAVVELEKPLAGTNAVITHMPLKAGYAVNAFAATSGAGLFAPDKNEASTVAASMIEETDTHGSIVPATDSQICDGDIGAPVCSSTGAQIAGIRLYGTCGLAGLVISRVIPAQPAAAPPAAGSSAAGTPAVDPAAAKCSAGAWKVTRLGQYKDFLAKYAPTAFQPLVIDKPILRNFPYVPDGLWGYKTKGDVKSCAVDATTLAPVAPKASSAKMTAKVSFAAMDKNAAAWGRFGIAPKSDPTQMTWLPARRLDTASGAAFDTKFEGVVNAPATAGDYVVAFRTTANGGETWTECDMDGIANGFSLEKALTLKVAAPSTTPPGTTPPGTTPPAPTPPTTAPASNDAPYVDPPSSGGDTAPSEGVAAAEPDPAPVKKKQDQASSGCSMSSGSSPLSSSLPIAGVLLGLAALVRRRRSAA